VGTDLAGWVAQTLDGRHCSSHAGIVEDDHICPATSAPGAEVRRGAFLDSGPPVQMRSSIAAGTIDATPTRFEAPRLTTGLTCTGSGARKIANQVSGTRSRIGGETGIWRFGRSTAAQRSWRLRVAG
jgi:hypothetical protein